MSTVTPPIASIPIGYVTVQGKRFEATPHPEYVRYFESLLVRVGGVTGPGTNDLAASQFEDAGTEETKALLFSAQDAFWQSAEVAALREQVAVLERRIDAMEQGVGL